ncbi:unnamed protein product, partial [Rhizoctonia solani]
MSVERPTPRGQYAKRAYHIRVISRVPVAGEATDVDGTADRDSDAESTQNKDVEPNQDEATTTARKSFEMKLEGTPLCSIDVTMSHVAVMYAAGRLLDSIREPFNASVIRAEIDLLQDREEQAKVSPEDYEKWKKENYEAKCIDPLVSEVAPDPKKARKLIPPCPYLCQLLFKSFSIGGKPGFWPGARGTFPLHGNDGVRNILGRSGVDMLKRRNQQTWFLYIDVTDPLRPRYAFMEEQNIIDSTREFDDGNRKPLYIFNAREHAYQLMIPESESYSEAKQFGEEDWTAHWEGVTPTGRRKFIKLPDDPDLSPDYKGLLVSRMKRAQEHPAVIRMQDFGWFTAEDAIKSDGNALLQGIWKFSSRYSRSDYHDSVVGILLDTRLAVEAVIIRSQPVDEPDHSEAAQLDYSFTNLPVSTPDSENSLKSMALRAIVSVDLPKTSGGILSLLENINSTHPAIYPSFKIELARALKERSSKRGTGFHEEALEWLSSGAREPEPGAQPQDWLEYDYDTPENHIPSTYDEEI